MGSGKRFSRKARLVRFLTQFEESAGDQRFNRANGGMAPVVIRLPAGVLDVKCKGWEYVFHGMV